MALSEASDGVHEGLTTSKFLGLPTEIRQLVWHAVLEDVNWERADHWFVKPGFGFLNLMLTCHQINEELKKFLPLQNTLFDRVHDLAEKVHKLAPKERAKYYRTLTVEFELDAPRHTYDSLIAVLIDLRPSLQELRLYFRGHDAHQTRMYVHDCAHVTGRSSRNAPLSGQRAVEMQLIQEAIRQIQGLRILVISNMNSQIYPAMFMHKPLLQFCHLTSDPRSKVHWAGIAQLGALSITPTEYFPPVKVLQISANNMLNAFSFPSNCALTLEHLTWTIPNAVRGSNHLNLPVFQNTVQLMNNLFMNAKKLTTLRICIQGRGSHGAPNEFLHIETALTECLTRLRKLRDVEVHIGYSHQTFGYDILKSLPLTVERFYANDRLVQPQQLYNFITGHYLFAMQGQPDDAHLGRRADLLKSWYPMPQLSRLTSELATHDKTSIKLWIDPTTYGPIDDEPGQAEPIGTEIIRKIGTKPKNSFVYGIIGEDFRRRDFIPLKQGNLKFVSYEFKNPDHRCSSGGIGETTTQMVLRLNGRLLDRERNRHLSGVTPGNFLKPIKNIGQFSYVETADNSEHDRIWVQLGEAHFGSNADDRDPQPFIDELMSSDFTDDKRYFGHENEAMKVFQEERVARLEELPPLTYPYFEDSLEKDDKCHWMCPEYKVPSLPQIDHILALQAARRQAVTNAQANTNTNGNTSANH